MPIHSWLPSILRGLHMLAVSAWLGGGLGVLLLLLLGNKTDSAEELQAYHFVIISIDDLLISPGAIGTVATGILLMNIRRETLLGNRWLAAKLEATLSAVIFGGLFLAPWLKELLSVARRDDLAVFDDLAYLDAYRTGLTASLMQMSILLALLWGSIVNRLPLSPEKKCRCCPVTRSNP